MNRKQPLAAPGISYATKRPRGWLLAHNSIRPTVDQRHGVERLPPVLDTRQRSSRRTAGSLCECGWRPDLGPHYSALAENTK